MIDRSGEPRAADKFEDQGFEDQRFEDHGQAPTKKEQILSLYVSGVQAVEDLALLTDTRPSYVASVLQDEGLVSGYFDLYTSTSHPMNVYSKFFAGRLGFKDVEAAREGVEVIDRMYRQFERTGDRAGQHHALTMALVMFNRARWTGKESEAEIYRAWLADALQAEANGGPDGRALP